MLQFIIESPEALVGLSAFLATFVASVMAEEQSARLKQGTFGAVAGTAVGGLAAVIDGQSMLLLIGIFGSAAGAIVGWIVYLGLSMLASIDWARRVIEYHVSGLKGVRDRLDLEERNQLLKALSLWSQNFRGMVLRETNVISSNAPSPDYNSWVTIAVRGWLTTLIDAFNLVLDALAEKPEYRARVTLIVFGRKADAVVGRHWISYAAHQQSHKRKDFGESSIAYQVLSSQRESPAFVSFERVDKEGEERPGTTPSYSSFFVFRLTSSVVLSVDWPGKLQMDDPYVNVIKGLLQLDVAPAIGDLLQNWAGPIASEVKLQPLKPAARASDGGLDTPAQALEGSESSDPNGKVTAHVPGPAHQPASRQSALKDGR